MFKRTILLCICVPLKVTLLGRPYTNGGVYGMMFWPSVCHLCVCNVLLRLNERLKSKYTTITV